MAKLSGFLFFSSLSFALDLELTQGINSALPIGINSFGNEEAANELTSIINNDLRISGQFKFISLGSDSNNSLSIQLWRQAGADSVLTGHVNKLGSNLYDVRFELLDAAANGQLLLTKSFQENFKRFSVAPVIAEAGPR